LHLVSSARGDRVRAAALALLSGALYWAAFPPLGWWPLAFVCWTPLLVALQGRGIRAALALGWAHGLAMCVAGSWLFATARSFAASGAAGAAMALLFFAYQSLRPALLSAALVRSARTGWPRVLAFPLLHAAFERFFPAPIPWYSAAQLAGTPRLMQAAAWCGAVGVGSLVALASAAAASAWLSRRAGGPWRRWAAVFVTVPAAMGLSGELALRAIEARAAGAAPARITLVQPNGPHTSMGRWATLSSAIERTKDLGDRPPDLVVWPETILPEVIDEERLSSWWRHFVLADGARRFVAPVLAGALVRRGGPHGAYLTNSAVLFDPDGSASAIYDKRKPLAFGEYIPFGDWLPALYRWIPRAGHLTAGSSSAPLVIAGHRLTPLICFEDLTSDSADESVREGSDLLVNVTDDAWFGHTSAWSMHLAMARYRAIEHGRYLVRASNQAGTAIVDPGGRVVDEAAPYRPAQLRAEVRWLAAGTPYERLGSGLWMAVAVLAAAMLLVRRPRRGNRRGRARRGHRIARFLQPDQ
jgi:apolipoprotein N-acyltransferase